MPNSKHEEFDEDCSAHLQDFSTKTTCTSIDRNYSYNDDDINAVSDYLSIAWEPSKTVPFGFSIPYLGFIWNLTDLTVAVPDRKKVKYMAAIEEWERKPTHALLEVQQLHGKLLHIMLVAIPHIVNFDDPVISSWKVVEQGTFSTDARAIRNTK